MDNRAMKKLLIFLSFLLHIGSAYSQDSVSTSATVPDSLSDHLEALRTGMKNLNVEYITNIRAKEIAAVVSKIEDNYRKYAGISDSTSLDSLQKWHQDAAAEVVRLRSMEHTINNYNQGLISTRDKFHELKRKYEPILLANPLINNTLNHSEREVNAKMDSLHTIELKIKKMISESPAITADINEAITSYGVSDESQTAKTKSSLWRAHTQGITKNDIVNSIKQNYASTRSLNLYVNHTDWGSRILLIVLTLAYIYWIFNIEFVSRKAVGDRKRIAVTNPWKLLRILGKGIIFLLTLLPLVKFITPTFLIQASQLVIMILFSLLLLDKLSKTQRKMLAFIFLFYSLVVIANLIVNDGLFLRGVCILFNLIALALVIYTKKKIRNPESPGYIGTFVYLLVIILSILAIVSNTLGYVDLARSFSVACAVAFAQSFTLQFFTEMIRRDVRNQFKKDRIQSGFWSRFNEQRTIKVLSDILRMLCIIVAIIVFANNLQFIERLLTSSDLFFNKVRKIGNLSFTIGNMGIAVLLLLVTNWLQKNISLLILGGENGKLNKDYNQKLTLFPLFRLAIILIGFFFAISALGMSLDKLTVVIGALSVGIGLGMQNIINNFVSGIILVFDKPFRVGDQIELADKKGRVKEIGIRASVLQTGDGADVIIPNGDLLSGRLVNWTLSQDYSRTSFTIQVDRRVDLAQATSWIAEAMESSPYCLRDLGTNVSVQDVSEDMIYLNLGCWINAAANAGPFRNDVLKALYQKFEEQKLNFYSVSTAKTIINTK
ncbi:mechanosensitive ion channel [Sphingobacterium spiritivorum]|uniref:Transporter, small conductance mechanosensitive ion channel MscS family protein n=2 Tax=Sphingobacterium spiritivorum TaxID=258 RepID=D7VT04_SPHSI|nr:transporter, small conductance mechanosensitive ion channel MscS family protein [Sphingobacterium spiritivorum ATCC 33861]QQT35078.1 mechanosensitive ion channel [Sphingobacterium spiritivorum]